MKYLEGYSNLTQNGKPLLPSWFFIFSVKEKTNSTEHSLSHTQLFVFHLNLRFIFYLEIFLFYTSAVCK